MFIYNPVTATGTIVMSPPTKIPNSCRITVDRELPEADPKLLEHIARDAMQWITIGGVARDLRYYGDVGIVLLSWDDPRYIGFKDGHQKITIDENYMIVCKLNDGYSMFTFEGEVHR